MTSEKSVLTEARLGALIGAGAAFPLIAVKPADTSRSSTTIADDPDLTLTVPTPSQYLIEALILYVGGTGAAEGDLQFAVTAGAGSLRLGAAVRSLGGASVVWDRLNSGTSYTAGTNGTGAQFQVRLHGLWTVTASPPSQPLTFRWCKNTAAGGTTDTTVQQFSYLAARLTNATP